MVADPERGVVVNLLESAGYAPAEQDTGDVGSDAIPYEYTSAVTNTFCWDDDDLDAAHVMTLVDRAGAEILRLQPNGACVTAIIEPGDYSLRLVHDGRSRRRSPSSSNPWMARAAPSRASARTSRRCCTPTSASAARSSSPTSPRRASPTPT